MQIYHCGCNLNTRLSPHYVNRMKSLRVLPSDLSGARGVAPDESSTQILEMLSHGAKGGKGCDWILWEGQCVWRSKAEGGGRERRPINQNRALHKPDMASTVEGQSTSVSLYRNLRIPQKCVCVRACTRMCVHAHMCIQNEHIHTRNCHKIRFPSR